MSRAHWCATRRAERDAAGRHVRGREARLRARPPHGAREARPSHRHANRWRGLYDSMKALTEPEGPPAALFPRGRAARRRPRGAHAPLLNAAPSRRARQVALRGAGPAALAPSRRARQVALRGAGPAASAAATLPSTPLGEAAPPSGTPLGDNSTRPHRRPVSRHGLQPPRASGDVARRRARCFRRRAALGRAARRRLDAAAPTARLSARPPAAARVRRRRAAPGSLLPPPRCPRARRSATIRRIAARGRHRRCAPRGGVTATTARRRLRVGDDATAHASASSRAARDTERSATRGGWASHSCELSQLGRGERLPGIEHDANHQRDRRSQWGLQRSTRRPRRTPPGRS